jgi:ribosome-binding factor A
VARVFVAMEGSDDEVAECLEGLNASKGFIRHQLAVNLGLRHAPELVFVLDRSEQYGNRVDELLQRIKKRKRRS